MNYSRLSKESLIHEIEQLNKALEYMKVEINGLKRGVNNVLETLEVQSCWIGSDYSVYWHNNYNPVHSDAMLQGKCYNVFFGLSDICEGCRLESAIKSNQSESFTHSSGKVVHQFNATKDNMAGILEFHIVSKEKNDSVVKEKKMISLLKSENEHLLHQNSSLINHVEMFTKALRTPLRAMNGYFLLESEAKDDPYTKALKNSSEQLFETLNKFMIYSRFETGQVIFKKEEFKLISAISDATTQARLYNNSGNIHLICAPTLPEVVKGDALNFRLLMDYFYETLLYLCGDNTIEVSISEISQTQQGIYIKITMSGKSQEGRYLSDIQEDGKELGFTELDTYSTAIGLKLMKSIVGAHNGTMELVTGLDDEVYMETIIELEKLFPREISVPSQPLHKGNRILIADVDKPDIPFEILSDYEVYFAETGDEALRLYFDKNPDLVLINVAIDQCDGFEVFDEIERHRKVHKPLVAMSNKLIDNERVFMRDYGFDDYIPKPLTEDGFKQIVHKFL